MAYAQPATLQQLEADLSLRNANVSDILTNPAYMGYHPVKSFRDMIKKFAKQDKVSLVTTGEPGTRITVKGTIKDKNNQPLAGSLVYVYHTDNKGWYSDTSGHVNGMEGDRRHARLFGYFKTLNDGSFQFVTIHPGGYPNSNLPQHIHLEVFSHNGDALLITELLFDDDERLTASMREAMTRDGAYIAKSTASDKSHVYYYDIMISN